MNFPSEISRLAVELGAAAFEKVCARLESTPPATTSQAALATLEDELAPWAASALLDAARREPRPDVLALALRSAGAAAQSIRTTLGHSDLVWSGPDAGVTAMHSLEQALRDLILGAERELWLVSFAAFRIPHLLAALREAAARSVALHFLLETSDDSAGALTVNARAAFPADLLAAAHLYVRPLENRPRNAAGRPAKLHAKFAVADRRTALLSSANLTADALERNMEAGILARGGPLPARLAEHLDRLVQRGIIVRRL